MTERYLTAEYSTRKAIYHLAWANEEYAYILRTDETNNELELTRYCHETLSRNNVEDEENRILLHQGSQTYTEITLQCNSEENLATEFVKAKLVFNTLSVLFRNNSNNTAKMCCILFQSHACNILFQSHAYNILFQSHV